MADEQKTKLRLEIAHVLFIDIVGYSKLLIDEQSEALQELNQIVRNTEAAREAEAAGQVIYLPTGDGMALVFTASIEDPVECALQVSQALRSQPSLPVRMGIHSGPVHHVADVNQRDNIAGAGINIAQRVMDCGDAGHILVSKRVADDLAQFRRWQPYLHELGDFEVKHGVIVSLVNLYADDIGNPEPPARLRDAKKLPPRGAALADSKRSPLVVAVIIGGLMLFALVALAIVFAPAVLKQMNARKTNAAAPAAQENSRTSRDRGPESSLSLAIPEKSVAVLPFENLSEDKANAYFADGIQEEILTRLSKIADLKVISRTSTQHYKSAPQNLAEIGRGLRVAHIVEGSVQKSGDSVRVNVQLIKAADDSHLWAETYDRKLTDIFAVESEIAKNIAETLRTKLTASEERAIAIRPTENSEAYQLYLKGRFFWNKRTATDIKKSIDYFNQAIGKDSNYALAYAGLADAWSVLPVYGGGAPRECGPKAESAARRAIELDESLSEPHASLGLVLAIYQFDLSNSIRELERAAQLNPNYAMAHHWLGNLPLTFTGQFDRAIAELKRALELDPLSMIINANLGQTYSCSRQYDAAIEQLRRTIEMDPGFYYAHYQLGEALEFKGDRDAAIAEYQKARELSDDPLVQALLAHAMASSGHATEAKEVLEQLRQASSHRYITAYGIGLIHLGLGERDEALRWFEKSYDDRAGTDIGYIKVDPFLDPLRGDPRFEKLAALIAPKT